MPPQDACFAVELPYAGTIEATSSSANISKFNINAFFGFTTTTDLSFDSLKKSWSQNYTIRSDAAANVRVEPIVIEAVDVNGLSSPQRFFNYLLNFIAPRIVRIDGLGSICTRDANGSSDFELVLHFNRPVVRPSRTTKPTNIQFVKRADSSLVHSINTLELADLDVSTQTVRLWVPRSSFRASNVYSILFDFGAFEVNEYCRPQTDLVKNVDLFKFDFIDDSVRIQYVTKRNQVLGGENASVEWTIDGGQVESCFVKADSDTVFSKFDCSGRTSFPLSRFNSSLFSFYFSYLTPCLKLLKYSETLNFR